MGPTRRAGLILDVVYNHFGPYGNSCVVLRRLLHRPLSERVGRGDQLRRPNGPPRSHPRQHPLLDRRVSPRRPPPRRHAAIYDARPRTSSRRSPRAARRPRPPSSGRRERIAGSPAHSAVEKGGHGLDMLWNDDFHHGAVVALTGRNEAYYTDYHGSPQEFRLRGETRVPLPGPALHVAVEASAGRRPPTSPPPLSSIISRITIKSRTPATGSASTSSTSPAPRALTA